MNAVDVLVVGDGLGDLVQQVDAVQLLGQVLLGAAAFPDFLAQIAGSLDDFLFQELLRLLEGDIAFLDFSQHTVEPVDQVADLVVALMVQSRGIVFDLRDPQHGLGQLGNGPADKVFQA